MITHQVICFSPDGGIKTMEPREGGIDLKQEGSAKVSRAAEIVWMDEIKAWVIKLILGRFPGEIALSELIPSKGKLNQGQIMSFSTYNLAVDYERNVMNMFMEMGVL